MNSILCLRIGTALTLAAFPFMALADPSLALQADSVTVPMLPPQTLNGVNYVIISAKVNSAGPFLVMLDSGAERNFADTAFPQAAGLKTQGRMRVNGTGPQRLGSTQTEEARIELGAVRVAQQKFLIVDLRVMQTAVGIKFSGGLGENIFKAYVVRIDYARSLLTLTPSDRFHYDGTGVVMPLTFDKLHRPQIEAQVEGITGRFMVDTGSDATLILNTPFVEKNGLRTKYASQSQTITTVGIGGETKVLVVSALNLQIGSIGIHGCPVGLSQARSGAETDKDAAGAFGGALLSHFVLTFDYSRKQLIFEPPTTPLLNPTATP